MKTPLKPIMKKNKNNYNEVIALKSQSKNENNLLNSLSSSKGFTRTKIAAIECKPPEKLTKSLSKAKSLSFFNLAGDDSENEDEINFNNVVRKQKEDQYFQVDKFLKEIQLDNLFEAFIKNKVYDLDAIKDLSNDKLIEMKITEKNRTKILDHISDINNRKLTSKNNEMSTQSEVAAGEGDVISFEENERIQAELFKKAVEEFRRAAHKDTSQPAQNVNTSQTTNNTNEEVTISNPKRFLMEIGGDTFNLDSVSMFADQANDVKDDNEYLPELSVGRACWVCYKRIYDIYPRCIDLKYFCSDECMNKYKGSSEIRCSFCNKVFFKHNAIIDKQNKFCSVDCYNKDRNKIAENENENDEDDDQNRF